MLLFEEREPQVALRALDATISAVVWEGKDALDSAEGDAEPLLKREASGAIGDLRQAIGSIAHLGSWIEAAQLSREESRLSILAGDVAAELEPFAERLDAALAAYLAAPREGS
jgi:hypothetical protein